MEKRSNLSTESLNSNGCKKAERPLPPNKKPRKRKVRSAPKRDFRIMDPERRKRLLAELAEILGLEDPQALPPYFLAERLMPAKIGITQDIVERYGIDSADKKRLHALWRRLSYLFRSFAYQNALIEEECRYDLDLNPAGTVSEEHRQNAHKRLKGGLEAVADRRKAKKAQSQKGAAQTTATDEASPQASASRPST